VAAGEEEEESERGEEVAGRKRENGVEEGEE